MGNEDAVRMCAITPDAFDRMRGTNTRRRKVRVSALSFWWGGERYLRGDLLTVSTKDFWLFRDMLEAA